MRRDVGEKQRHPRCRHQMSLALNCQQIVVVGALVLMTCFPLTSTAPTTTVVPLTLSMSTSSTVKTLLEAPKNIQLMLDDDTQTSTSTSNSISTTSSPASSSSEQLDIVTTTPTTTQIKSMMISQEDERKSSSNEMSTTQSTETTSKSLIGTSTVQNSHKMEPELSTSFFTFDADKNIQQLTKTRSIEKPIKLDADNFAVMEDERDIQTMPNGNGGSGSSNEKKLKMKENKKKAAQTLKMDKKQQAKNSKQKTFSSDTINHPTIVPTNEPSVTVADDIALETVTQATLTTPSTMKMKSSSSGSESENVEKSTSSREFEPEITTTTTTMEPYSRVPTSIKIAPTTIKSTTRTTIKSSEEMETTTKPFQQKLLESTELSSSVAEAAVETTTPVVNINETANRHEQQQQRNDNVIVLNTNTSGLIVVDIMDNFGGTSNATETIEIKMDLIDDGTGVEDSSSSSSFPSSNQPSKDDIFFTTIESTTTLTPSPSSSSSSLSAENSRSKNANEAEASKTIDDGSKSLKIDLDVTTTGANSTPNDDIILINVNSESVSTMSHERTTTQQPQIIKWKQVKSDDVNGNIKITFDNVDLPNQNVNVSIENGELVIDSIDIGVLNRAEEVLRKSFVKSTTSAKPTSASSSSSTEKSFTAASDSLEIELIEDDSEQKEESNFPTQPTKMNAEDDDDEKMNNFQATTIHFDIPLKHDHSKKIELSTGGGGSGEGEENEDGIKIKTTDKDSDTIFYMSNAEVKVIESIPTASPPILSSSSLQEMKDNKKKSNSKKYRPAVYEEDVIVDVPSSAKLPTLKQEERSRSNVMQGDKYEEDIILSPLTSPFDPKDINYIGEAFLDVEESQNGVGLSENHHIIPLTSDVVIQPAQFRDSQSPNGIPIIGEIPPQIELEEMVFSDDYESKQLSNLRLEEYFLNSRLVKNSLEADVPRETILDTRNITYLPNRTHITINTIINGTNMTTISSSLTNGTAFLIETNEEIENADLNEIQTLLLACFATLTPLFLCVIVALTIRYCWRKYRNDDASGHDLMSDKSTDLLAEKGVASTDDLKSAESGMKLDHGANMGKSTELLLTANGDITTPTNHNGNGSIITMTLKNNHLIVETEERNDISRDTRETKMHYSPSDKDGVFIVEAARGADQNGSHKPSPLQQKPTEAPLVIPEEIKIDTLQSHFTPSSPEEERKQAKPEQVEVHTPPADLKDDSKPCNGTKTGLSQSDLSLTSSNSSNQNYSYGDKDTYQCDEKGYKGSSPKRIINVHSHDLKPLIENSPPAPVVGDSKPVITSTLTKNESPVPPTQPAEVLKSDKIIHNNNNNNNNNNNSSPIPTKLKDKEEFHKLNGIIKNGLDEIISVPDENFNDAPPPPLTNGCHAEINLDSLSSFPAPPPEDINDQSILELTSMDSLPPPPPEMTTVEIAQS